jgi:hypothetical protein
MLAMDKASLQLIDRLTMLDNSMQFVILMKKLRFDAHQIVNIALQFFGSIIERVFILTPVKLSPV